MISFTSIFSILPLIYGVFLLYDWKFNNMKISSDVGKIQNGKYCYKCSSELESISLYHTLEKTYRLEKVSLCKRCQRDNIINNVISKYDFIKYCVIKYSFIFRWDVIFFIALISSAFMSIGVAFIMEIDFRFLVDFILLSFWVRYFFRIYYVIKNPIKVVS